MTFTRTLTGAMLVSAAVVAQGAVAGGLQGTIRHVLPNSVDGLHDADLTA